MVTTTSISTARELAEGVPDPELPAITIGDLGIVRAIRVEGQAVEVDITPTYTGCPAMVEIGRDIANRLESGGFGPVRVRAVLDPPWTTDWISSRGREKLASAGIAPPGPASANNSMPIAFTRAASVCCPQCGSPRTARTAAFGASACRDLHRCLDCLEPFEHMKEI